jgi:dUTP pyrophosphatase
MNNMLIKKIREVKTPARGTSKSAGLDFFVPDDFEKSKVWPGKSILIPSGIKAQVPEGYALIAFNKSGVATKEGLVVGACVVDEDYEGEIHLHMINVGDKVVDIVPGQKLTQFILIQINYSDVQVVQEFPTRHSERGSGGFGSTGI